MQFVGDEELRRRSIAWVERSCAEQGIPVTISDSLTIEKVAAILAEGRRRQIAQQQRKA